MYDVIESKLGLNEAAVERKWRQEDSGQTPPVDSHDGIAFGGPCSVRTASNRCQLSGTANII